MQIQPLGHTPPLSFPQYLSGNPVLHSAVISSRCQPRYNMSFTGNLTGFALKAGFPLKRLRE